MKAGNHNSKISVHAISGNHVVTLGLDATDAAMEGLLGFAIHRTSLATATEPEEAYWLKGYKPFKEVVPNPIPGAFYSTLECPVQSFTWADFTAKSGQTYIYKVVPIYGSPKNLKLGDEVAVKINTEPLLDDHHEIYFNRGVAASQAYALKFGDKPPHKQPAAKHDEIYKWLSRGLFEAIIEFIKRATDNTFKLRVALYELDYLPVMQELKKAQSRGVDVKIIYSDKASETQSRDNETTLFNAGFTLDDKITTFARKNSGGIFHNKFFILMKGDKPIQVFTGSTNISEGGIFGHSNLGHCIKDEAIAKKYFDYWEALKTDPAQKDLSPKVETIQANISADKIPVGNSVVFSPRKDAAMLDNFVTIFGKATEIASLTLPFNLDMRFMAELEKTTTAVRYITLNKDKEADKKKKGTDIILKKGMAYVEHFRGTSVLIAPGGKIETGWGQWLKETLTGFNGSSVQYIHTKFMLIDPVGDSPIVITGSANFSEPSIDSNDENMLIIKGNTRVADIYLGEFFRIFDHLYFRYMVTRFATDAEGGFLKSKSEDWTTAFKKPSSSKFKKRKALSFGFENVKIFN
jgi:phosphatidylserine/phosphatidylglycerophosphate/cardiolipin synthase-like enzyme